MTLVEEAMLEETFSGNVSVSPEFFKSILRDYPDWLESFIGEFIQNGKDAGSSEIRFKANADEAGNIVVTCSNNGRPMTKEVLLHKLLALGGTTKTEGGTTGGFGRAKELLYFSHQSYSIRTGNYLVVGSGSQYKVSVTNEHFDGVESVVCLANVKSGYRDPSIKLVGEILTRFVSMASMRHCEVYFQDEMLQKLVCRRIQFSSFETEAYRTYKINTSHLHGWVIVRHNGLPMFRRYIGYKFRSAMLVELKKPCVDVLVTSRTAFRDEWGPAFENMVLKCSIDKYSAGSMNTHRPLTWTNGILFAVKSESQSDVVEDCSLDADKSPAECKVKSDVADVVDISSTQENTNYVQPPQEKQSQAEDESRAKNRAPAELSNHRRQPTYALFVSGVGQKLPARRFWHRDYVSKNVKKLLTRWSRLLQLIYEDSEVSGSFAVGLNFASDIRAQYKPADDYSIYLINPSDDGKMRYDSAYMYHLPALAVHEFTHLTASEHDEMFAAMLTMNTEILVRRHKEVAKILRSNDMINFAFPCSLREGSCD